jgi:hypothetical protein
VRRSRLMHGGKLRELSRRLQSTLLHVWLISCGRYFRVWCTAWQIHFLMFFSSPRSRMTLVIAGNPRKSLWQPKTFLA